ncbi:DNA-packaging protein [Agrobacterium tumefaciens]|uniref:DNA-packaging protein n=1 Tax=Agrobacterium tumefaciens TaxID=358 RepID=UPI003C6C6945
MLAGRGFGKTRTGAEWVREQVKLGKGRIALIAPTASDARDVMVEGESGLLAVCWAGDKSANGDMLGRPSYEPSKRRVTWANGAVATLFSAEEPERLRGPQHEAMWCDELAAWKYLRETWDMAMFGLRLGNDPRTIITTTPKPLPLIKEIIKDPTTVVTKGSTFDNSGNLAPKFLKTIKDKYEGSRLGRQELEAEILDDLPGALWSRSEIDEHRIASVPELQRVVVSIDPSGTRGAGDEGDSIGIVVAGLGIDGRAYVMADRTCKLSPAGWGKRAVQAYYEFEADRIVAERNFGGAMVQHVVSTTDSKVAYKEVTASRGKVARAEPVAALYEQGKVSHVGSLPDLEDQMCQIAPEGYVGEGSPDRADALVWAITELMLGGYHYGMLDVV